MIRYFKSYLDDNKFVHSIDNVIVVYDLKVNYDRVLEKIRSIAECLNCKTYYERLNLSPCVKYSFWVHTINIDSCYICLGKHSEKGVEVGTGNKAWYQVDKMRIEINPNKWYDSDLFKMLMDMVKEVAYEGIIDCIDYAIDVPCNPNDVVVLRSRKEYGEYKGTRYYGQRGKNGMVRIYNKMIESGLLYELTRIETRWKCKERYSSVDFGVINRFGNCSSDTKLSLSTGLILDMLQELKMLGSDNVDKYLSKMDPRTRKLIINQVHGELIKYEYDKVYLNKLMDDIKELYNCEVPEVPEIDYSDEFMFIDTDEKLPWEL